MFSRPTSERIWRNASIEGQALDVAHGAADFDDDDICLAVFGHKTDAALDFIGDMGNDLDGATQVVATPLFGDDFGVDSAGGDIRHLAQVDVDEALVVTQIQGLSPRHLR